MSYGKIDLDPPQGSTFNTQSKLQYASAYLKHMCVITIVESNHMNHNIKQ